MHVPLLADLPRPMIGWGVRIHDWRSLVIVGWAPPKQGVVFAALISPSGRKSPDDR
jgi:hypothetical protein